MTIIIISENTFTAELHDRLDATLPAPTLAVPVVEGVDDASNLWRHAGPGAARVELQFDAIGVGSVAQGKLRRSHSQTYLECVLGGLRSSDSEGVDVDSTAAAGSSEAASASDSGLLDAH